MRYPEFLKKGDLIGISAPSAGVGRKLESFDLSEKCLKDAGWRIRETESVRLNDLRGGSAPVRGRELNSLFSDPEVKMVMAAAGGDFLDEMLPYVDWELLKDNPKWLMGGSDPTGLVYPYTTLYDVATLYGSNAGSFDLLASYRHAQENPVKKEDLPYDPDAFDPYYLENVFRILAGDLPVQKSSEHHMKESSFLSDKIVFRDRTVYRSSVDKLNVSGRCIGGCIDVLKDQIGTCFDGTKQFLERYRQDGIIWYFDNFALSADILYRTLLQMRYAGWFDPESTRAVLIGRTLFESTQTDMSYDEGIKMAFPDIPVVWEMDIGHTDPHFLMINGAMMDLAYENGAAEIAFRLE